MYAVYRYRTTCLPACALVDCNCRSRHRRTEQPPYQACHRPRNSEFFSICKRYCDDHCSYMLLRSCLQGSSARAQPWPHSLREQPRSQERCDGGQHGPREHVVQVVICMHAPPVTSPPTPLHCQEEEQYTSPNTMQHSAARSDTPRVTHFAAQSDTLCSLTPEASINHHITIAWHQGRCYEPPAHTGWMNGRLQPVVPA